MPDLAPLYPVVRDHLDALTDDVGIMQHAIGPDPDPAHGYCTDDVARALQVDLLHQRELGWDAVAASAWRSVRFLDDAFDRTTGRFRNFRRVDESWLDGGEWELLEQLQLSDKLPSVFTDTWQRKLRKEGSERMRQDILRKTIGDADATKVESVRSWLNDHPAKSAILT